MFKNSKLPFILCGNIGNSFIGEIDKIKEDTFVILEASSFQLEKIKTFCPFIGCLLNIGEDHLDRHFSFKNYLRAKEKVFQNQTEEDYAILNYDDPNCRKIGSQLEAKTLFFSQKKKLDKGIYKEGNKIILNLETEKLIFTTDKVKLTGKGNYENMMTSILSGFICKIEPDIIQKTLNEFLPLPHRFEKVGEKKGVVYINDSKSTNPHSVINALKSIEKKSKVILIMGGQYKQVSFKKLIPLIKKQVKLLILFGAAKEIIANEIKESKIPYLFVNNLKEAVQLGAAKAETGETVLFSPACSSFDMFKNYMERGNVFKEEVTLLS